MIPSRIPWQTPFDVSGGAIDPVRRLQQLLHGIMSDDTESQLASTISLREFLTEHPLLEAIIRQDVVSRFVQFLADDNFPQLKHEAAWMLAEMTGYEGIEVLVGCGTVPLFVKLINSDNEEDRSLAVLALRNIACESIECRDHVLSCGALMTLLYRCDVLNPTQNMLRAATETLRTLFDWSPCPPLAQIEPALPVLEGFLYSENSHLLYLSSALLGRFFEKGDNDETRQALMDLGVIPRLMELFEHERTEIHNEVTRTIYAVLKRNNRDHSQVVIDQNPIPSIASYLTRAEDTKCKIIASYIVYKIAMWDQNQLEKVVASGVVQKMILLLQDHDPNLESWCVRTISRVTSGRNHEHISLLVSQGCIEALCDTLSSPKQRIVRLALSALEDILGVGQDEDNLGNTGGGGSRYARMILEVGGLEKIRVLMASKDEKIYEKAIDIVFDYFNEE